MLARGWWQSPLLLVLCFQALLLVSEVDGFSDTANVLSTGKKAICVERVVHLALTANNTKILYSGPSSQAELTSIVVNMFGANPTIPESILGDPTLVSGNFGIFSKLCLPASSTSAHIETVQLLTHGGSLSSMYWDLAPGYSYVDAAAEAGYATLSYDRIGAGRSEHPDPIQLVQAALQVEIAHALVEGLRTGKIGGRKFSKVVAIAHSSGSFLTVAQNQKYPQDLDAVVHSGLTLLPTYVAPAIASLNLQIANTDRSGRFDGLENGYVVQATPQSIQFPFYRYPNYDPRIFEAQVAEKQTQTLGEVFTLGSIVIPVPDFTGPVALINGENDYLVCGGNCTSPQDWSAQALQTLYPAAGQGSLSYVVSGSGHNINAHYSAPKAFAKINDFFETNGFSGGASVLTERSWANVLGFPSPDW
ncbi:MAG: hypothetical protein M1831_002173 [Alyxoria varia]|nr:MAG: hypothetical protein M1831_002173 [Alyxoria varia]